MIVYRVLSEPCYVNTDQGPTPAVPCLTDQGELPIFFETDEMSWQFYHELLYRFEPLTIGDEEDGS